MNNMDSVTAAAAADSKGMVKVNAVKIILSAMWFKDTTGVDRIFLEYKPPKAEMDSIAYKPYDRIYRLCYSFHSSFEEIVNFIETIKPRKIYCIALPDSTSEKQISEYFYDSNGQFSHFSLNRQNSPMKQFSGSADSLRQFVPQLNQQTELQLRKRKSFDETIKKSNGLQFGGNGEKCRNDVGYNSDHDKSSTSEASTSFESKQSLNFGSDSDEDNKKCTKKLRKC
jgi:hypothetical protein